MHTWKTSAAMARTSPSRATITLRPNSTSAQQHGEDEPSPAYKHLSPQPIPTASAFEEVDMEYLDNPNEACC